MRARFRRPLTLAVSLALLAPSAFAQPKEEPKPEESAKQPEKKKKKKKPEVTLGGRIFVRDTITKLEGQQTQNDFSLSSVRANIDLRKYGWLRTSIEFSLEDDGEIDLEDVYIAIDLAEPVRFTAGRFKRPISPIALESAWSLPIIERGLLSDNVVIGNFVVPLNLGGRSEGAMLTYHSDDGVRPDLRIGLFNARLPRQSGGGAEIADLGDNLLRDAYARAAIEPLDGFAIGGSLGVISRARRVSEIKSGFTGSLDLSIKTSQFRGWMEAFAGRTTMFDGVEAAGSLLGLRILIAPRFEKPMAHVKQLEPYVIFSALDPTDRSDNNRAVEIGAGIAVWFKKAIRFQADYTYNGYEEQFPSENLAFIDRSTIRFQLGSQFR